MTYQGWKNYETWVVKLWIDNTEGIYHKWNSRRDEIWEMANFPDRNQTFTPSEQARIWLADELKQDFERDAELVLQHQFRASLWADLLGAALSEVDWFEMADNMFSDTENYVASNR